MTAKRITGPGLLLALLAFFLPFLVVSCETTAAQDLAFDGIAITGFDFVTGGDVSYDEQIVLGWEAANEAGVPVGEVDADGPLLAVAGLSAAALVVGLVTWVFRKRHPILMASVALLALVSLLFTRAHMLHLYDIDRLQVDPDYWEELGLGASVRVGEGWWVAVFILLILVWVNLRAAVREFGLGRRTPRDHPLKVE